MIEKVTLCFLRFRISVSKRLNLRHAIFLTRKFGDGENIA